MGFREGDSVEVQLNQEGFVGSYFEATVVMPIEKNKYIVKYKTLVTEYDKKCPLHEIVDADELRPSPPKVTVCSGFNQDDCVDAYHNEGWWVGRITGRSTPTEYYVYFDSTSEELSYEVSDLRVHLEYYDGEWFTQLCLEEE